MYSLRIFNNTLTVSPISANLKAELSCTRTESDPKPGNPSNVKFTKEELFQVSSSGNELLTYIGLMDRVMEWCKDNGGYTIVEDNRVEMPKAKLTSLKNIEFREGQKDALAMIMTNRTGIIKWPTGMGKSFIVGSICGMYPTQRIMITVPALSILDELAERVSIANPSLLVSKVSSKSKFREDANVLLVSSKSIHRVPREWPDMILYDEVHTAAAPKVSVALSQFSSARRYGFSATPVRADGTQKIIEALFGPVRLEIKYQEAVDLGNVSPMKVIFHRYDTVKLFYTMPVAIDRHGLWRNRDRNEAIQSSLKGISKDKKVLILVATTEHALYLHKVLPEYRVVHRGISKDKAEKFKTLGILGDVPIEVDKSKELDHFKSGKYTKYIATMTWSTGVDIPDLAILVRADGRSGEVATTQTSGRATRVHVSKTCGLVYDYMDTSHKMLESKAWVRFKRYQKLGWEIEWK